MGVCGFILSVKFATSLTCLLGGLVIFLTELNTAQISRKKFNIKITFRILFVNRTLRKAEIPIVDDALCKSINKDFSGIKQICAGGEQGNPG